MSERNFAAAYTENRRIREIEAFRPLESHIKIAKREKILMLTLVTKQDLWWQSREQVKEHYQNGEYSQFINNILLKKGSDSFQHEYLYETKELHDANAFISLLKDCTKEKIRITKEIRNSHYQLYTILLTGLFTAILSYNFYRSSLSRPIQLTSAHLLFSVALVILLFSFPLLYLPTKPKSFLAVSNHFRKRLVIFCWSVFGMCFLSFLTILGSSMYASMLILITFILTFVFIRRLQNMYSEMKVIDYNLAKVIRSTSQFREHIASVFVTKIKLEVTLTTAEDALENPRLYF